MDNLEKPVIGIAMTTVLVDLIMRFTPDKFDKKRFAPAVCFGVAMLLSFGEALATGLDLWGAFLRGMTVTVGAGGAHSYAKNYVNLSKKAGGSL